MSIAVRQGDHGLQGPAWVSRTAPVVLILAAGVLAAMLFPWAVRWPEAWTLPAQEAVTAFFSWLATDASLGLFTVRELTRFIAWLLSWPLEMTEALLFRGIETLGLGPVPWVSVAASVFILGHWLKDARLGLFCALGVVYIAAFGLWTDAMKTLALVIVAVAVAALLGFLVGIAATRSRRIEAAITPFLDVMQSTPHMAYLAPAVVMFGFGQVPALIATVIFAMPPMARCVVLGIRTVASDVVEAGRMAGCTTYQLLWKVELPTGKRTVLLGLNQVVMQTLAMVVIASLVGATGLGQRLLFSLQQLRVGKALEEGIAIVIIAVVLDRLTQAYAMRQEQHVVPGTSFAMQHRHAVMFIAVVLAGYAAAAVLPAASVLPPDLALSYGGTIDSIVRWISLNFHQFIRPVRDWLTVEVLLPLRNFYLVLPWPMVLALVGYAGWRLRGPRMAALMISLPAFILVIGNWVPAMLTLYLVTVATILSVIIGVPIGIWATRSKRAARVIMAVCDTLQTFPSFIYLIPVVMLLQVGDLANIIAILAYASVPSIRYTYLGITRVPVATVEAAVAMGTSSMQRLRKVELPIALPEIMLGINQTIMMALIMTAITALIGSRDLGQEIYKSLPGADTGRGLLAGLSIAFIGITADRLIGAWAHRRKVKLGLA